MRRLVPAILLALSWWPAQVTAGNSEDVIAGIDAALTGGAVVANVHTGASLWFNPAGVARLDASAVELTGALYRITILRAPGILTTASGGESTNKYDNYQAVPRALTYTGAPSESLRFGVGLFFSQVQNIFVQDSVASDDTTPTSEWFGAKNTDSSIYHISAALGWKVSKRFLFGGAFDIVIATQRENELIGGAYAGGAGGAFSTDSVTSTSGGGLQLKTGIQWLPIDALRLGLAIATPSYLVYLNEDATRIQNSAPPVGPPSFEGTQIDEFGGSWAGVEPGLLRAGAAWLGKWGWLELDFIYRFPLKTPELGLDLNGVGNVRLGGIFRLSNHFRLGVGAFTDRSPRGKPQEFGAAQIDFYGFSLGFDYANKDKPPEGKEKGFYFSLALAVRYAHGRGDIAGLLFSSTFDPAGPQINLVDVKADEIGINVALKAAF